MAALTLEAPEKYLEKTGEMTERNTIWAPLSQIVSNILRRHSGVHKNLTW